MPHGLDLQLEAEPAEPARPAVLRELAEEHRAADRVVEISDQGVQRRRHIFAVGRHHLQRRASGAPSASATLGAVAKPAASAAGPCAKP